jgi:hypothetical protein
MAPPPGMAMWERGKDVRCARAGAKMATPSQDGQPGEAGFWRDGAKMAKMATPG